METRKLTKEELGDKVLFPRTQLAGLTCEASDPQPQRPDFAIEAVSDVPNMGSASLIVQQSEPHMVFQLFETESEQQFDDYLGKLLGMHHVPSYIAGRTDFMVLFQGCRDNIEINQLNYKDVLRRIHNTQDAATRWWHLYGKE